jgi:hypothetical protein
MGRNHRLHVEPRAAGGDLTIEPWPVIGGKPLTDLENRTGSADRYRCFRPRGARGKDQRQHWNDDACYATHSHLARFTITKRAVRTCFVL